MKFPSVFKTPSHRSFNFKPRYYDARKEALSQRMALHGGQEAGDAAQAKARIRASFSSYRTRATGSHHRSSNVRLVVIIAALSFLSYLLLS